MSLVQPQTFLPFAAGDRSATSAAAGPAGAALAGIPKSSPDGIRNAWFPRNPHPVPPPEPPEAKDSFFGVIEKLMDQLQTMLGKLGGGTGFPGIGQGTPGSGTGLPGIGQGTVASGTGFPGSAQSLLGSESGFPGFGNGVPKIDQGMFVSGTGLPVGDASPAPNGVFTTLA